MKNFLIAVSIALASVSFVPTAHAEPALTTESLKDAGFDKLSQAERAQVLKTIADQAAQKGQGVLQTTEKVEKWVDIGERIGKMMSGAAKEVGIAVNDFVNTPVGQMTAALIVWNYMGNMVTHLVGGLIVLIVGLTMTRMMIKRRMAVNIEYNPEKRDYLGRSVKVKEKREALDDTEAFGWWVAQCVVIIAFLVTTFTY